MADLPKAIHAQIGGKVKSPHFEGDQSSLRSFGMAGT
jgi:hypothetical protein